MITEVSELEKIYNYTRKAKEAGYSPEQIDSFLKTKGSSIKDALYVAEFGAEKLSNMRKRGQAYEEKKKDPDYIALQRLKAIPEALNWELGRNANLLEKALSGATFGGYDWLNKKMGGNFEQRSQQYDQEMKDLGLGGLQKVEGTVADLAGTIKSPVFKIFPEAKTLKGDMARNFGTGAIFGALSSGFKNDSLKDVPTDALISGAISGVSPLALKGIGKGFQAITGATTGKGADAIKNAYEAGKTGNAYYKQGKKAEADELVEMAKIGASNIKREAGNAIAKGKSSIANKLVSKTGFANDFKAFNKQNYVRNGVNTASKGERKVIGEVKSIINKYKKAKQFDVGVADAMKQEIGKIAVDKIKDPAAYALKNTYYNMAKDYINKASPEYATLMQPYAKTMKLLKDVAENTGVKGQETKSSTAIKKLIKASTNPETKDLINKVGGEELVQKLSGYNLKSLLPETAIGRALATGLTGAAIGSGGTGTLAAIPLMSPRLVGDASYLAGKAARVLPSSSNVANIINALRLKGQN